MLSPSDLYNLLICSTLRSRGETYLPFLGGSPWERQTNSFANLFLRSLESKIHICVKRRKCLSVKNFFTYRRNGPFMEAFPTTNSRGCICYMCYTSKHP